MLLSVVVYICFEIDIRVNIVLNECVYFNVLYVINDKIYRYICSWKGIINYI